MSVFHLKMNQKGNNGMVEEKKKKSLYNSDVKQHIYESVMKKQASTESRHLDIFTPCRTETNSVFMSVSCNTVPSWLIYAQAGTTL